MNTPKGRYAEGTAVSADRSLQEIKQTLRRFGATGFAHAEDETRVALMFVIAGGTDQERRVRFTMYLPAFDEKQFRPKAENQHTLLRTTAERTRARYEQEINRKWRALAEGIKAKLVLVEEEIETIEQAFWAHIVLPNNQTLYEATQPQIAEAYRTKQMPDLLPGLPARAAIEGKS